MSIHQHATLEDTVYLWFGSNDTSGSGNDGATPAYDVRLAGAAAAAAPVLSGSATLLSHVNYPAGAHEVAVAATAANGFAAGNTYGVFCTLLVDSQNPTGFVGSFALGPIVAKLTSDGADLVLVDGKTLPAALQIIAAGVLGKVSGAGTGTEIFVGLDGVTTRATVTVTNAGNRTAVTYA